MTRTLAFVLASLAASASLADPDHDTQKTPLPKELDTLKSLAGDWEGMTKMGDKEVPYTVRYEVTAGGSAVMERAFVGTPHEMVTMYTAEGNKIGLTHYCMLGNHPKMSLTKSDDKGLVFEMAGVEGLRSKDEMHMHAMVLTLSNANRIREEWTSFEAGKRKDSKIFELTRKK
jgi:hypothetical protein